MKSFHSIRSVNFRLAVRRRSFAGSLLTAVLATGLLLVGSTSASATTVQPSTPVAVPTAVDAGLAQDYSDRGQTILSASLMAAAGITFGTGSFLTWRRRRLHEH